MCPMSCNSAVSSKVIGLRSINSGKIVIAEDKFADAFSDEVDTFVRISPIADDVTQAISRINAEPVDDFKGFRQSLKV